MRRLTSLFFMVLLAGCGARPLAPVAQPKPVAETPRVNGQLVGLTPNELVGHFGRPELQIREGTSLKLQFRGRQCVLDAYLYPQSGGALRVTHVDTRTLNGADTDQAACILALETPS